MLLAFSADKISAGQPQQHNINQSFTQHHCYSYISNLTNIKILCTKLNLHQNSVN